MEEIFIDNNKDNKDISSGNSVNQEYIEKQVKLSILIDEISKPAHYHQIKLKIYKYIKKYTESNNNSSSNNILNSTILNNYIIDGSSNNNDSNNNKNESIDILKQILNDIVPPESLLSICNDFRINFLNSPNENNEIFDPLKLRIEKFQILLESYFLEINPIEQLLRELIEQYKVFIKSLVEKVNSQQGKSKTFKILNANPLLLGENLVYREISLEKAYEVASYNPNEYEYERKNENGLSIGGKVNGVYYKVDNGSTLLRPAKENAVFTFYKNLYGHDKYITSTQLIVISQLPILAPDKECDERKTLFDLKVRHGIKNAREVFKIDPALERRIDNALHHQRAIYIQASLFIEGENMLPFLDRIINNNNNNNQDSQLLVSTSSSTSPNSPSTSLYEIINRDSFSAHILSSLLLLPTDYKADNLTIESNTGIIVGIDNDGCLESEEIQKIDKGIGSTFNIRIKNVLFTLPLMNEEVSKNIREKFITHHPNLFLLNWLVEQIEKESVYYSFIKKSIPIETENKKKVLENTLQSLNLPLQFMSGLISDILSRFLKIKKILKSKGVVTHTELFKQIHPFASAYYEALERSFKDPLSQVLHGLYNPQHKFTELLINNLPEELNSILEKLSTKQFLKESNTISLRDTIKELILNSNYNDFQEGKDIVQWFEKILEIKSFLEGKSNSINSNSSIIEDNFCTEDQSQSNQQSKCYQAIKLHESWYKSSSSVLVELIENNASDSIIREYINMCNLGKEELNNIKDQENGSLIHVAINSNNSNMFKQIITLHSFGAEIDDTDSYWTSPLCLSAHYKNYELFKLLIDLGAGSSNSYNTVHIDKISNYYKSLTQDQQVELKPYLSKLNFINPKIVWKIALDQFFPPITTSNNKFNQPQQNNNSSNNNNNNNLNNNNNQIKIIKTVTCDRVISSEYWKDLVNVIDGQISPIKPNPFGLRAVPFIKKNGMRLYIKFNPQLPGTEYAVTRLSSLLFGYISPYCELGAINDIPVLLTQGIKGEPLINCLNKPEVLSNLDPSNLSKVFILAMLINPGDGNLGNYIISPIKVASSNDCVDKKDKKSKIIQQQQYRIINIDQDQAFLPPISKDIKGSGPLGTKLSLQVETVLFLMDQMNDPVHKDVIDSIKNKDLNLLLSDWLKSLKHHHQSAISLFSKLNFNFKEKTSKRKTVIGVSFAPGMIKQLFSKLMRLQTELNKQRKRPITHFELLEVLEPMVACRYKELLNNKELNLYDKFERIKYQNKNEQINGVLSLTSSIHSSSFVLESRDIPNIGEIQQHLWSGDYGPDLAILELENIQNQHTKINQILKDLGQFPKFENGNSKSTISFSVGTSPSVNSNSKYSSSSNNKSKELKKEITEGLLEELLKEANFSRLTVTQEKEILDLIKGKELRYLTIRNSKILKSSQFKNFNLQSIVNMDLSGSEIESISNYSLIGNQSVVMPSLKQLVLDKCSNLFMLRLHADNLKLLKCSNCTLLKIIELTTPTLESLNLSGSNIDHKVLDNISKQSKLLKLNLSNSKFLVKEVSFSFPNLLKLISNNISNLEKVSINLPNVEIIDFDNCPNIYSIIGFAPSLKQLILNASLDLTNDLSTSGISGFGSNNSLNSSGSGLSSSGNSLSNSGGSNGFLNNSSNNSILSNLTININNSSNNIPLSNIFKSNVCGIEKHLNYFKKLIGVSNLKNPSTYSDSIKSANNLYDYQFWYLPEKESSPTTSLYLRNSSSLILFFDLSMIESIEESINIFDRYCSKSFLNDSNNNDNIIDNNNNGGNSFIKPKVMLLGIGYGLDKIETKSKIEEFRKKYKIDTFIYLENCIEQWQQEYIRECLFSNLRNDKLELFKTQHYYQFKKNIEKDALFGIHKQMLQKDILIIEMMDLLEGLDFSNIIGHFDDVIKSIYEILELLTQYTRTIDEIQQQQQQSSKKDFLKIKMIQNKQQDIKDKLDRYQEVMNISIVFRNLKRLYYLALVKDFKNITDKLEPIFYHYQLCRFQKDYFKDDENINFNFKNDPTLFKSVSSSLSSNITLCRITVSGFLQSFQWYMIKNPHLLEIRYDQLEKGNSSNNNNDPLQLNSNTNIEFPNDKTPLAYAIEYKCNSIIQWLINNGYVTKGVLSNALIKSCIVGNLELVKLFVENNADVNCCISTLEMTPVLFASKYGHTNVINYLLDKGVQTDKKNKNGWNCIHYAAKNQNREIIDLVLKKSPHLVNAVTNVGETPLYLAVTSGSKNLNEFCWSLISQYKSNTKALIDGMEVDIINTYLK